MRITNNTNISLPFAVWLVTDGYDFHPGQSRSISATSLLKSVRQILLREQLTEDTMLPTDASDLVASRLGHTIHDGIERAWTSDYADSMRKLGYPEKMIQRIAINPIEVTEDMLPVYLEQRSSREIMGYQISGKFDMIIEGDVHDFKSTSAYAWVHGGKDDDYRLQGSIYRWLNPEKITGDHMVIHFVFTDWQKVLAKGNPNYPQQRIMDRTIELMSLQETEAWIKAKLTALEDSAGLDEPEIPFCSDEELWRSEPKWKYYSDPANANVPGKRATKNFDNAAEANAYKATKNKGVVIMIPGQVKACGYCPAFPICSQKDLYEHG